MGPLVSNRDTLVFCPHEAKQNNISWVLTSSKATLEIKCTVVCSIYYPYMSDMYVGLCVIAAVYA